MFSTWFVLPGVEEYRFMPFHASVLCVLLHDHSSCGFKVASSAPTIVLAKVLTAGTTIAISDTISITASSSKATINITTSTITTITSA